MLHGIMNWEFCHRLYDNVDVLFSYESEHIHLITVAYVPFSLPWLISFHTTNSTNSCRVVLNQLNFFASAWIQGLSMRGGGLFRERCVLLLSRFAVHGGHFVHRGLNHALSSSLQSTTGQAYSIQSGGNDSVQLKRTALAIDENANRWHAEEAKNKMKYRSAYVCWALSFKAVMKLSFNIWSEFKCKITM